VGARPRRVLSGQDEDDDPTRVGDEPLWLAQTLAESLAVPVWVHPRRALAVAALRQSAAVDVILADDGLQHRALARQAELVVLDGGLALGNGRLLPAGPLREPPWPRLQRAALVFLRDLSADHPLRGPLVAAGIRTAEVHTGIGDYWPAGVPPARPLAEWAGQPVHALAGIARPERFFAALKSLGLAVTAHPLPDHAPARLRAWPPADGRPVLLTEKDWVKWRRCLPALELARCAVVPLQVSWPAATAVAVRDLASAQGLIPVRARMASR